MAYVKTTWVDEITPTSAANMNNLEQGVADAHAGIGKRYVATPNAAASTVFNGLAGDTDLAYKYEIVGWLESAGVDRNFTLRPTGPVAANNTANGRNVIHRHYIEPDDVTVSHNVYKNNDVWPRVFETAWAMSGVVMASGMIRVSSAQNPVSLGEWAWKVTSVSDARMMRASVGGFLYTPRVVDTLTLDYGGGQFTGRVTLTPIASAAFTP